MNVRFSEPAFAQLGAILNELALKSPGSVAHFAARIDAVITHLGQFPHAYQEVENRPGIRRAPMIRYPYLVFYRIVADEIIVVALVHGARDEPWQNL